MPAAAGAGPGAAPCGDNPAFLSVLGDDAAAEVGGVELHAPDGLVDRPQLGEGERSADEGGGDAGDLELNAQALHGVVHNAQVVEREFDRSVEYIGARDDRSKPRFTFK